MFATWNGNIWKAMAISALPDDYPVTALGWRIDEEG